MSKSPSPYSRTLKRIEAVTAEVLARPHDRPRAVAGACDIAPSTGYRMIGALEAGGYLGRDADGTFVTGGLALRIGLSAWGFGGLYRAAEPVLHQLRREAGRTAFLGMVTQEVLQIGPFSLGRGAAYAVPGLHAAYQLRPLASPGDVHAAGLAALAEEGGPVEDTARLALMGSVAVSDDGAEAVVGLLLAEPPRPDGGAFAPGITAAAARLRAALDTGGNA